MRRPPVVRIECGVARTAFALSRQCEDAFVVANTTLELRRAGDDDLLATVTPLDVDEDGRLVFVWDDRIGCLEPGLYRARFVSRCLPCGEITIQLGGPCAVTAAEHIDTGSRCEGPDDVCGRGAADDCSPAPILYIPPYDVPRGC